MGFCDIKFGSTLFFILIRFDPIFLLSDLAFFVEHVFACLGVILPGLHLFRMQAFVLGCRIEVTGTGTGHKSDFVSH